MDNSLDSILSEQPAVASTEASTQQAAETQVQHQEQPPESEAQGTGEKAGAPPEQTHRDDPLDKARKGLEAAAAAERKRRQEAEARAEAAERRALELQHQNQQRAQQQEQPKPDLQEPKREDFATDVDYIRALARHEAKLMRQAEKEQEAKEREEREAVERATTLRQKTESIIAEAMTLEGFDLQAFASVPVTDPMMDAILESDAGAKLVQFLTANPAEAERISKLTAARQHKELTRIEDKLAQPAQEETPPPQARPKLPETLTQARNAKGRFEPAYSGPTPLNAILASK